MLTLWAAWCLHCCSHAGGWQEPSWSDLCSDVPVPVSPWMTAVSRAPATKQVTGQDWWGEKRGCRSLWRALARRAWGSSSADLWRDMSEQRMLLKAGDSLSDGTGRPRLWPAVMATCPLPDPAEGWAGAPRGRSPAALISGVQGGTQKLILPRVWAQSFPQGCPCWSGLSSQLQRRASPHSTHVHMDAVVKEGVPQAPQMDFGNIDASSLFLSSVPLLYPFSLCFICCQSGILLVKYVLLMYHLLLHQLS